MAGAVESDSLLTGIINPTGSSPALVRAIGRQGQTDIESRSNRTPDKDKRQRVDLESNIR